MIFDEFLTTYNLTFNDEQKAAILAADGPVCLLASPGSGKTRTLVSRVGYLILCCGVDPAKILTMTYTVAATRDMSERFAAYFGGELAERVEFRTINGVAQRVINMFSRVTGKQPYELISDEKERAKYIRQAYLNVRKEWPVESDIKDVGAAITLMKNMLCSDREIARYKTDIREFSKIYEEYQRLLSENKRMDFDDQLVTCYKLLSKVPDLLAAMQNTYEYICLDEAQDTSRVQHEIVALLASRTRKLFMVGDEDQSIYKFRGAFPQGILDFQKRYPEGTVLLMEKNYRSDGYIVRAADAFIQKNTERHKKHIVATRPEANRVIRKTIPAKSRQYDELLKAVCAEKKQVAVLARNNESLIPVVDRLEAGNIPYNIRQMELSFFTHPVVTDIRNFLLLALDNRNADAFLGIYYKTNLHMRKDAAELAAKMMREGSTLSNALYRTVGKTYQWKKADAFAKSLSGIRSSAPKLAIAIILSVLEYSEYLERMKISRAKIDTLKAIAEGQQSINDFLSRLDRLQEIIGGKARTPGAKIILSTIHSSKGLEYDSVHLIDAYDGCFPEATVTSKSSKEEKSVYEEERRLFYVGVTRAKDHLTVYSYDDSACTFVDEFIKGPDSTAYRMKKEKAVLPADDPAYRKYAGEFRPGVRVLHKTFGEGTIVRVDGDRATVDFIRTGIKVILLSIAYTQKILRVAD